jgi:phosphoglucan,water dikinase
VWASLWTPRAALARRQAGISQAQAHMAVLIQPLLAPDYSFILHTVNPINHHPRDVYAELAVGLGETLAAAAARGTPYRFVCDKASGAVTVLAFANFSQALRAGPAGGVNSQTVDYSQCDLTCDAQARTRLGCRLAGIARVLEQAFQKPQDLEGAVIGTEIHLVQARAQQGLRTPP